MTSEEICNWLQTLHGELGSSKYTALRPYSDAILQAVDLLKRYKKNYITQGEYYRSKLKDLEKTNKQLTDFVKGDCEVCRWRNVFSGEKPCAMCWSDNFSQWEWNGTGDITRETKLYGRRNRKNER